MFNKPTLFVNSITKNIVGKENQNIYDSRKNIKSKVFHRIDDIVSFKSLNKRVFVLIDYERNTFYGEIILIDLSYIHLKKEESIILLQIKNISDIKITSTL